MNMASIIDEINTWKTGNRNVSDLRELMIRVNECHEKVRVVSNLLDDYSYMAADIEALHKARRQLVIIRNAADELMDINEDHVFGEGIDVNAITEHIENLDGALSGFVELELNYGLKVEDDIWIINNWDGVLMNVIYSVDLGRIMFPGVMDSEVEDICVKCGGLGNMYEEEMNNKKWVDCVSSSSEKTLD